MMLLERIFPTLAALLLAATAAAAPQELRSPDGKLRLGVSLTEAGEPDAHYRTNPQAYAIERRKVDSRTTLEMYLAPGGGFAISFREVK